MKHTWLKDEPSWQRPKLYNQGRHRFRWRLFILEETKLPIAANDNIHPAPIFVGNIALALDQADTDAALSGFVVALARNQARIDHLQSMDAANDNTKH
jgi:hypothetical protein